MGSVKEDVGDSGCLCELCAEDKEEPCTTFFVMVLCCEEREEDA